MDEVQNFEVTADEPSVESKWFYFSDDKGNTWEGLMAGCTRDGRAIHIVGKLYLGIEVLIGEVVAITHILETRKTTIARFAYN